MQKLTLGDRMKGYYEKRSQTYLNRRTPVIIRIDGRAFHTFTKGLKCPYDEGFMDLMDTTTRGLIANIQGCKFGYVQSDEISLFVSDYDTYETEAWFDYNVQKLCSISASMATAFFTTSLRNTLITPLCLTPLMKKRDSIVTFDARAFNIPKEDALNCFIYLSYP